MKYFEELTGKRYFFVDRDEFYWNVIHKEPFGKIIPNDSFDQFFSNSFTRAHTKDVEINDTHTLEDFLKTLGDNYIVFCLNGDSIYHYGNNNVAYCEHPDGCTKKFIKVYIDYKN